MKEFIEFAVKGLVDNPNDVSVTSREDGHCTVYEVIVNKKDMGQVVGKNGKTANALRVLTRNLARGKHVVLKIRDAK